MLIKGIEQKQEIKKRKNEEARIRALEIADVDDMDGLSFENYVARLLKNEGFDNIQVTQGSSDLGVDIIASKNRYRYSIQTKRTKNKVSRRAVSDAVAGKTHYSCNAAMVITNSYLSKPAKEFALSSDCEIVERDMLSEWIMRYQGT
jgi:HJR/Mrr/RecB family endonuclease